MGRGTILFASLFLLLPVLLFAGAWAAPAYALLLALLGIMVLATGFTIGIAMLSD